MELVHLLLLKTIVYRLLGVAITFLATFYMLALPTKSAVAFTVVVEVAQTVLYFFYDSLWFHHIFPRYSTEAA